MSMKYVHRSLVTLHARKKRALLRALTQNAVDEAVVNGSTAVNYVPHTSNKELCDELSSDVASLERMIEHFEE